MVGRISEDPDVGTLSGAELIPVVSGGVNKRTTSSGLASFASATRPYGISIGNFGAAGDGVTDDSGAINSAMSAGSGSVYFDPSKKYYIGSSITVPYGIFLIGDVCPGEVLSTWNFTSLSPQLILGPGVTINLSTAAGIQGFAVVRQGISLNPATVQATLANVAAYSGTGITLLNGSGQLVRDCVLIGHALGIFCSHSARFDIRKVFGDCISGVLVDNMHDVSSIEDVTFNGAVGPATGNQFPSLAITGAANNGSGLIRLAMASTSTLLTGNRAWVVGVTGTTEANGPWVITVVDGTHVDLQGSTFTNPYVSGGTINLDTTYRSGIGFEVTNSENPRFVNCFTFGHQTTWHFGVAAGWVNCVNCGSDGANALQDPTTTSILVDSSAYAISWMGGWTSSHGTMLSFTSSSTAQSVFVGCSFNGNGGNPNGFSMTGGVLMLNGCSSRTTSNFNISNAIGKLQIDGCSFSATTPSYGGTAAQSNTWISNSNLAGINNTPITVVTRGNDGSGLTINGNASFDTNQGAQIQLINNNAASGVKTKSIRVSAGGALQVLNNAYSLLFNIADSGGLSAPGSETLLSGTAIPAGGTTGAGLGFSSTSNFGIYFGSGLPTLSAAQGSLYLRSDGSSVSTRLYVNTNGSTGWTNVTTAT